jgi:hypothetical protein
MVILEPQPDPVLESEGRDVRLRQLEPPGPIEDVATMTCRRSVALAKPVAARAMPCSV